jgi:hypothetical protein
MPNEGIALMCMHEELRIDWGQRKDTQQVPDGLVLGEAPNCSHRERGASSLLRNAVLHQLSCHLVIELIKSDCLLDAIHCDQIL